MRDEPNYVQRGFNMSNNYINTSTISADFNLNSMQSSRLNNWKIIINVSEKETGCSTVVLLNIIVNGIKHHYMIVNYNKEVFSL